MKIYLFTLLMVIGSFIFVSANDYVVNFAAKEAGNIIDSIKVVNLNRNKSVVLHSGENLSLTSISGFNDVLFDYKILNVYPNPISDYASVVYNSEKAEIIRFDLTSIDGKLLATQKKSVGVGRYIFSLSVPKGVYLLSVSGSHGSYFCKVISKSSNTSISLQTIGSDIGKQQPIRKIVSNAQILEYETDDILLFRAYSGKNITVQTKKITSDTTIDFDFLECKDADGNYYPIVQIGNQIWMAENLKYLPKVSVPDKSTKIQEDARYYVYNYFGEDVNEAKNADNYKIYGVLYNKVAAENSCPRGWHLPSYEEWRMLVNYLGGNLVAYGKLKENSKDKWLNYDPSANNESGFSALPAGSKNTSSFDGLGSSTGWWTSTDLYDMKEIALLHYYYNIYAFTFNGYSVRYIAGNLPVVKTSPVTFISSGSAQSGISVTSVGNYNILSKGVCWGESSLPNITSSDYSEDGSGSDSVISSIQGLKPSTTYHVRAYVKFNEGLSYGNEIEFKTHSDSIPLTPIIGNYTANGESYFQGNQTWNVTIASDKMDLSKVWINNLVNESHSIYGIVNENRTEIWLPIDQEVDNSVIFPKILLKGYYPDTVTIIPSGGYITCKIGSNGDITILDEYGIQAFRDIAKTIPAGWFNIFKTGVTLKKRTI